MDDETHRPHLKQLRHNSHHSVAAQWCVCGDNHHWSRRSGVFAGTITTGWRSPVACVVMHVARQLQTTLPWLQLRITGVLKIWFARSISLRKKWQTNSAEKLQRGGDWLVIGCCAAEDRARLRCGHDQFVGRINFLIVRS